MIKQNFAGIKTFFYLYIKRDRWLFPFWTLLPVGVLVGHALTFVSLTQNKNLTSVIHEFNRDDLVSAVHGPIMSVDLVGATLWRSISFITLLMGIGAILTVIRHSRTDEEEGRAELFYSLVVGKYASITAALFTAILGVSLSSLLLSIGMTLLDGSFQEVLVFYLTLFFAGVFYAGSGLLFCQLKNTSSSVRNISILYLTAGLFLNILNNFGGSDLFIKWLTPISWTRITEPFSNSNVFGLVVLFFLSILPCGLAFFLYSKRDVGRGLLVERPGPSKAKPSFKTPFSLAWRIQRSLFWGWLVVIVLYIGAFAAVSPTISGEVSTLFHEIAGENWIGKMPFSLLFIHIGIYIMSLLISLFTLILLTALKKEEVAGRNEMILDKKVDKKSYMMGFIFLSLMISTFLLIVMGLIGGAAYSIAIGNWDKSFWQIFIMGISKIPAVWTIIGLFSFLYGLFPKATFLSWGVWGLFSVIEVVWEGGLIPWSVMQLSPFAFVHYTIPITELSIFALSMILIISLILIFLGVWGYRKRDIMTKA